MSRPVVRRPSLPLTAEDEAALAVLRTSPEFQAALAGLSSTLTSPVERVSEGVLLHAVFEAGLAAVRERAQVEGYAQLAADNAASAHTRRTMSRRRTPAWADES